MLTSFSRKSLFAGFLLAVCMIGGACGARIEGTYSNPSGVMTLDLRSGGKAQVTLYNETRNCAWKATEKQLVINCDGDSLNLTIHDDGSLSGPFTMGILRKSK